VRSYDDYGHLLLNARATAAACARASLIAVTDPLTLLLTLLLLLAL